METQSNLPDIVVRTLESIEKDFYVRGLYRLKPNEDLFCIHVNGIVNVGLAEFSDKKISINIDNVLASNLFSRSENLFIREINGRNEITIFTFNVCKNALAVLSLIADNRIELAKNVISTLYNSPLFNKESGLFYREMNSITKKINGLILSQTNLWIVIALSKLQDIEKATQLMKSIEKSLFDQDVGMFFSQDCELASMEIGNTSVGSASKTFFSDDQALAAIAYDCIGLQDRGRVVLEKTLHSGLYDQKIGMFNRNISPGNVDLAKTTYKNSLLCIALSKLGFKDESRKVQDGLINILFDKNKSLFNFSDIDSTKIPDNSMLALIALSEDQIKHIIF